MKQAMVKSAGFRVRNKADALMLAEEITAEDVTEAIGLARLNGGVGGVSRGGNAQGCQFLSAVDAIAGAVPHTNEAAKKARGEAEAIQHHFGTPSYFSQLLRMMTIAFLSRCTPRLLLTIIIQLPVCLMLSLLPVQNRGPN
jgi:hypothetical protein